MVLVYEADPEVFGVVVVSERLTHLVMVLSRVGDRDGDALPVDGDDAQLDPVRRHKHSGGTGQVLRPGEVVIVMISQVNLHLLSVVSHSNSRSVAATPIGCVGWSKAATTMWPDSFVVHHSEGCTDSVGPNTLVSTLVTTFAWHRCGTVTTAVVSGRMSI